MKIKHTIDTFIRMYVTESLSCKQIAVALNCSSEVVRRRLKASGVEMRSVGSIYPQGWKYKITESDLRREYVDNHKTQDQIAEMFGCGSTLIFNLMKKHGIVSRDRRELMKGRKFSKQHLENMSKCRTGKYLGDKSPSWKGGRNTDLALLRKSAEHQRWRKRALKIKGDVCGVCGKDLLQGCPCCSHVPDRHVHHIKPFADHPELRFTLDNALVLCETCHMNLHFKKGTGN